MSQLNYDLNSFNRVRNLTDESIPLLIFLRNAHHIYSMYPGSELINQCIEITCDKSGQPFDASEFEFKDNQNLESLGLCQITYRDIANDSSYATLVVRPLSMYDNREGLYLHCTSPISNSTLHIPLRSISKIDNVDTPSEEFSIHELNMILNMSNDTGKNESGCISFSVSNEEHKLLLRALGHLVPLSELTKIDRSNLYALIERMSELR